MPIKGFFTLIIFLLISTNSYSQKVGLVLSGGGTAGLAHIGVLIALEENNIPIDFITGTSMGALIGAMYASGYTPKEIKEYFLSHKFSQNIQGKIDDKFIYYYAESKPDAAWVKLRFSKDDIIKSTLPTNIISTIPIDFDLVRGLAPFEAAANYNFDSLMIPFRCVAADIEYKQEVVFKSGRLTDAVRASMAYPFFLSPLEIDGRLLYDGGLYNNFPIDILCNSFYPDFIIGSNVSGTIEKPVEDDIISQIKNMIVKRTVYNIDHMQTLIIEPSTPVGTFDFNNIGQIIDSGYAATINKIDSILFSVNRQITETELAEKRKAFKAKAPEFLIGEIDVIGLNAKQSQYAKKLVRRGKDDQLTSIDDLEPNFYRLINDKKVRSVYPMAKYNKEKSYYNLILKIKKERDFALDFGGNFASRPINTAFIGFQYNFLGRQSVTINANSYFGKLYGSSEVGFRYDIPGKKTIFIDGNFTLNRWNYFRSRATFFEDIKPSYVVQFERYGELAANMPVFKKGKLSLGVDVGFLIDEYYQTRNFVSADTADKTTFDFVSPYVSFTRNSLNRKQYANSGSFFQLKARYIDGMEKYLPGSTSDQSIKVLKNHKWWQAKMVYDNYYKQRGNLRLGVFGEVVYSFQNNFQNYTSSIIRAPAFQPTPESRTLFLETFRSYQYAALGHKFILAINNNFDFRFEGYIFQPYILIQNNDGDAELRRGFEKRFIISTATAVYNSPVGPVSVGLNYYLNVPEVSLEAKEPITFLFHFGYIIFNRRALH